MCFRVSFFCSFVYKRSSFRCYQNSKKLKAGSFKKDLVVIVRDHEKQFEEQKWKNISKFRDVFNTMPCDVQLQCEQTSV